MKNLIINIHNLPAKSGDCFLLDLNNKECILLIRAI